MRHETQIRLCDIRRAMFHRRRIQYIRTLDDQRTTTL